MDKSSSFRRVLCPMEGVSTTFQSLDTVRTLHQTVVSLRAALEDAKSEIQRLRSQISAQSDVKAGIKERKQEYIVVNESPESLKNALKTVEVEPTISLQSEEALATELGDETQKLLPGLSKQSPQELQKDDTPANISVVPDISVVTHRDEKDSSRMSSKIDVKIKVMSNIKVDSGNTDNMNSSQPNSAQPSSSETEAQPEGDFRRDFPSTIIITRSSKEDVNVEEQDDFGGDPEDSVFVEEIEIHRHYTSNSRDTKRMEKEHEVKEEVDDIELIFSSDENREPIQEDLVSISEYDPWQTAGSSGTPVLVKFASLPSEQDSEQQKNKTIKIPISTTCDAFCETDTITFSHEKSLESTDSFDNQTTNKSSSLDKDNDDKRFISIGREESQDSFDNRDMGMIGKKWTNYNVVVETDISKCGIIEENSYEMCRRNTCPNPPAYRPILSRHIPARLAKYCRRGQYGTGNTPGSGTPGFGGKTGPKRSSSAQTDISALPDYWKSESQLHGQRCYTGGLCTLPSKFVTVSKVGCPKHNLRSSERTQEARRVLLSDINFTSMVPELSRSADHLCQDERRQEQHNNQASRYYKGNLLKTPDYAIKGITPSTSMTSPGVSQWTVNENSFGTQTIQTGESWGKRGGSFDSCRSYSTDSRCSGLDPHHRSRSVPSIRCGICRQPHNSHGIRTSESMHYTPRVTFQEPCRVRGSLPDLRHDCVCTRRFAGRAMFPVLRDSSGSTESLLDEADTFVRKSMDNSFLTDDPTAKRPSLRRMSENDIETDYAPSKQSLPFLPRTAKCLKPGHLAKVISKNGRVVVGRVRYVGPLITAATSEEGAQEEMYVGVQLQSKCGDCDGSYEGRKIFDCEPLHGLFVPFKKVVMAWTG